MPVRCRWCGEDPLYVKYHDTEWGVPVHNDQKLFEMLLLEGVQAGLSWLTVLRRRENYRRAYDGFDYQAIAAYDEAKIASLLADNGIIRNKSKIIASVNNARAFLVVQKKFGSFDDYIWRFVDGRTIRNSWSHHESLPAVSAESLLMSKDLQKRGFKFVGPTICYAYMQAVGMVNDHVTDCYRYNELA